MEAQYRHPVKDRYWFGKPRSFTVYRKRVCEVKKKYDNMLSDNMVLSDKMLSDNIMLSAVDNYVI
jgi:hypothetical protein